MRAQLLFYGSLLKVNLRYSQSAGSSLIANNVSNPNKRPFEVPACFAFYWVVILMCRVRLGCVHHVLRREILLRWPYLKRELGTTDSGQSEACLSSKRPIVAVAHQQLRRHSGQRTNTLLIGFLLCSSQETIDQRQPRCIGSHSNSSHFAPLFLRKCHVFLFACLVSLWHSETQSVVLFLSASPYHGAAVFFRAYPSLVSRRDFLASTFITDKSVPVAGSQNKYKSFRKVKKKKEKKKWWS